jgi:hypothetical protein
MSGILPDLTAADLLEQQKRIHPAHQVVTWDGVPAGEAVYSAIAAAFEDVAQYAARSGEARLIMEATGPTRATGTARITFASGITSGHDVGINAGQVIAQTAWGERFRLAEGFSVAGPQSPGYTVDIAIESVWANGDGNVRAIDIRAWALPAGVDPASDIDFNLSASTLLGVGAFIVGVGDGSITVAGLTDCAGGKDGTLDLIGAGRGIARASGESDVAYRVRIRSVADTLTPAAMLRLANRALEPYGVTATYLEAGDYGWAIGHATRGCPTVSPVSRVRHFVLLIPPLDRNPLGWAIGHAVNGCPTVSPCGTGDVEVAGFLGGLQESVNSIKPAGIWGSVVEGVI